MIILDTTAAALHYGVTARTIRRWVTLGLLTNHGTTRRVKVELLDQRPMSARVCCDGEMWPQTTEPPATALTVPGHGQPG